MLTVLTILAGVAEFERDRIRERTKEGRTRKRLAAAADPSLRVAGPAPFGCVLVDVGTKACHLAPDPALAPVVEKIKAMSAQRMTLHAISAALAADGVKLSHQGVANVLRRLTEHERPAVEPQEIAAGFRHCGVEKN